MKNVTMKFADAWDYLDFDFYLNLVDSDKNYCVSDVEQAYIKYIELRHEAYKFNCEDFREFLVESYNLSLEYDNKEV